MEAKLKILNECMTDHPDFPKPGILFKNIMPLFSDPKRLEILGEVLEETIREKFPGCTKLVGLESRGFLIGNLISIAFQNKTKNWIINDTGE